MFKVLIKQYYNDFNNISTRDYSGIEHKTIKEANQELSEALEHEIDNEMLFSLFVTEE